VTAPRWTPLAHADAIAARGLSCAAREGRLPNIRRVLAGKTVYMRSNDIRSRTWPC